MINYSSKSIGQFLVSLGSCDSSPGGGSAAALTAATAVALVEMVVRINARKHQVSKTKISAVAHLKKQLLKLLSEDAANFKKNIKAFSAPKENSIHQKALKVCAKAPMAICALCKEAIEIAKSQKNLTSRWLYSDLAESAVLLDAAFDSARLNAEINLLGFTPQNEALRFRKILDTQSSKIKKIKKELVGQF